MKNRNSSKKESGMKSKPASLVITLAILAGSVFFASAGEGKLKVGDPAPKLQSGKWIQGDPVKDFEPGKAYIVEFWATWCPPCRASIPHLNEIHEKFENKGLVVIGQDIWEKDDSRVAPFVQRMGTKMSYRVVLDDKTNEEKGMMVKTWMTAAGREAIPSAFVVDTKGRISWIGHPMQLKDETIEQVLRGKFDLAKAAAEAEENEKIQAKVQDAYAAINSAMREKNWDKAMEKLSEAEKIVPAVDRSMLEMTRFRILIAKEDYVGAYRVARNISESNKDDGMIQNELAWRMATDPSIKVRDLKLAETIANRANAATGGEDAPILDTLARVKFMQGKKEEAIELQEKALGIIQGDDKAIYQKVLDGYKKGELPDPS